MLAGSSPIGSTTAATADGNCVQVALVTRVPPISDLSSSTYSDDGDLVAWQQGETTIGITGDDHGRQSESLAASSSRLDRVISAYRNTAIGVASNTLVNGDGPVYCMSNRNATGLTGESDGDVTNDDEAGLFEGSRRTFLKAAGASVGGLLAGGSLVGSASAETADGNCVQVDFVTGTTEISDLSSSTYSDNGRLIKAQWGETVDNDTQGETTTRTPSSPTCDITVDSGPTIDFSAETATVNFSLSNCGGDQDLLLVSYESPCNGAAASGGTWDPTNAGQQVVFDTASVSTQSAGSLTVDVPPLPVGVPQRSSVEAYHPLDTSDGTNCRTGSPIGKNDNGDGSISVVSGVSSNTTNQAFDLDSSSPDGLFSPNTGAGHPINGSGGTVATWFNFDSHDDFARVLQVGGSNSDSPGNGGYSIEFEGSTNQLKIVVWDDGDNAFFTISNTSISSGNWYFVVAVVGDSNTEARLHVFEQGSGELTESPITTDDAPRTESGNEYLQVGAGDGNYTDGRFDEVYAFSTALTRSEVTSLYNASF